MSAPKYSIIVTEPAEFDIRDILSYTLKTWGAEQMLAYKQHIAEAFQTLHEHPTLGRPRYGYLAYPVKQHKIFYRLETNTVYIIRILHKRMDAMRHLP
jgi:toxin ParE1/3/4